MIEVTERDYMPKLTFIQKNLLEKGDGIVLVNGTGASGEEIYSYIRMQRSKIEELYKDIEKGQPIDFHNYGEIILCGEGKPDDEAMQYMEEEYEFEHT